MSADAQGNDIGAVGVPVTGFIGLAPYGTVIPTPVQGASETLVLDPAFKKLGLLKEDGGPQFAWAADGDPIVFWQDGYSIPSGLANVTLTLTAAETLNALIRQIIAGMVPDVNGYLEVDGGGNATRWVAFSEEIFANGAIRRRVAPSVTLQSSTEDQSTRGDVMGNQLVFDIHRHAAVGMKHFGEWVLPPESAESVPVILSVTPSGESAGEQVTIQGAGFTGATAVTFGGTAATDFTVVSDQYIVAILPAGTAGAVDVVVTTPEGVSAPFSYTRA